MGASLLAIVLALYMALALSQRPPPTALGRTWDDERSCGPLVTGNPDGNYIVPRARGAIVYRRVDHRELQLDAWVPSTPSAAPARARRPAVPLVVVIHGGGFTSGSRITFVGQFLEMLTGAGYAWASVDYRLGGISSVGDAEGDIRAAVAFLRCHARELGVDPDRVILLGEDAGAVLAARVATSGGPGVIGAVLAGATYADNLLLASATDVTRGTDLPRRDNPIGARTRLLVVHGTGDSEVPFQQAESWCRSRRGTASDCELVPVVDGSHRPENWWPVQWGYKARVVAWLNALAPTPIQPGGLTPATAPARRLRPGLHKRIAYASSDGPVLRTLDAWLAADQSRPVPAVVLLHGGGWEAGDRVTYITPIFEPLARAGLAWFSVDYRLTPAVRHPEQLGDARAAVAFIRAHAREFGIDPRHLVLVGESASGQMVMLLANEDPTLAGVASFYGVYDFLPMVTDAADRSLARRLFGRTVLDDNTRRLLREYSPLYRATTNSVPVLLVHGTGERLWEQGVRMDARLRELGVAHALVRVDGAPHGMENWEGHPEWQFYKNRLVEWIQQRFTHAGPQH